MDFSNLQSRVSPAYIPAHRTQIHPRMHSFSSPFSSTLPKPSTSSSQTREKWWILAAGLLIIPFLLYLFAIARGIHHSSKFRESKPKGFGIIIHAGTTGSRIHVFEFLNEGRIPFVGFDGKDSNSLKLNPALVEFGGDPENAGKTLSRLLDFARERVPKAERKDTKVRLMATGGIERMDSDAREGILESCRQVLRSSGFLFKDEWASVINGQEEGVYAWVAANYAMGTLGGDPEETTGIIELGGASMQVIFASREPPPMDFSQMLKLAGVTYNLYSQSMLHFGQDAAWELLRGQHDSRIMTSSSSAIDGSIMSPCIPKGYYQSSVSSITLNETNEKLQPFHSAGNFSACRSEAVGLLQKGKDMCMHPPCRIIPSFMPEFQGKPIAAENFFYTSKFFGLVPKASLLELEAAGRHYCEDDWGKLKDEHSGIDEGDLLRYCFSSAYIVALLHDGLGIPMNDRRIGFTNPARSIPLDWTLGAFILQTVVGSESEPGENLARIVGDDSFTYLSLFAILLSAILAAFYISRWRRPQLKTVYDLEKGHYIVTRVPR
ncbi:putative apyrase 6 [Tasmannia lanceolata]|uniref:putative apyrase 6 n=1 Tax=Tasmannia lanceolata TaxID=3420 RepID=UPI004062B9EC